MNRGADPLAFRSENLAVLRDIGIDLVDRRTREPADDIATALAQARTARTGFSDDELEQIMVLLGVAGTDTTKHTTTHTVVELWRDPAQRDWLRDDIDSRVPASTAMSPSCSWTR